MAAGAVLYGHTGRLVNISKASYLLGRAADQINQEGNQMADKYDYALLSGWAYYRTKANQFEDGTLGWMEVARFPGGVVPDDPISGFSAGAYKKGNEA